MIIIESIGEYTICLPESGGKAGKGHNKTSTVQVRKRESMRQTLLKGFRYDKSSLDSYSLAKAKAKEFVYSLKYSGNE